MTENAMSATPSLIQDLESAIAEGTPAMRLDALTRVTDLFLAGSGRHSDEQLALFDDILMVLIETIEVNARAQLSRRLSKRPDAPQKVVRVPRLRRFHFGRSPGADALGAADGDAIWSRMPAPKARATFGRSRSGAP